MVHVTLHGRSKQLDRCLQMQGTKTNAVFNATPPPSNCQLTNPPPVPCPPSTNTPLPTRGPTLHEAGAGHGPGVHPAAPQAVQEQRRQRGGQEDCAVLKVG